MRDGFIFYESFRKAMKGLPAETQLLLYNAIADYALYDEEPDFGGDGIALGFFTLIRPQLDANIRKRENGARGGRPGRTPEPCENQTETTAEPSENQTETKVEPSDNQDGTEAEPNVNANANAKANGNAKEKENARASRADKPRRFTKPTVEEIRAYCRERGNGIDAQRFFDFYESKNWRVGNQHMTDWQAAVRTWEGREKAMPGSVKKGAKPRIEQHDYTDEQLDRLLTDLDGPEEGLG